MPPLPAQATIDQYRAVSERLRIRERFAYEERGLPDPAEAYLASLGSLESRRNTAYALDIFAAFLSGGELSRSEIPWHELTAQHRDAVRAHLLERYADRRGGSPGRHSNPVSVNARLAAWRQVLRHAWDKGLMPADAYQRAANVSRLPGERLQKRRFVPEEALAQIFRSCALDANRARGARDSALVALYFGCGMRRFEALSLFLDDIDRRPEGWLVTVIGKRNKERTLGIPVGAAAFIRDWLALRGSEPGPLFYPVLKNGRVQRQPKPMTTQVGNQILNRRLLAAGVARFSPHDLRATSTTILASLLDLFQTMDWAGHEDANTARGYVIAAKSLAQEIAARLHVPHFGEDGAPTRPRWDELTPPGTETPRVLRTPRE